MYAPRLHWLNVTGDTLSGAAVNPKFVQLSEKPDMFTAPTEFTIYRRVTGLTHDVEVRLDRVDPERGPWRPVLGAGASLEAVKARLGEYRSAPWPATVLGSSNQTTYRFQCSDRHWSPDLHVTAVKMSLVQRALKVFGIARAPEGMAEAGVEARIGTVELRVKTVSDPVLRAEILWPWSDGPVRLRDVVLEELQWTNERQDDRALEDVLDEVLPARVPDEWHVAVDHDEFRLEAGEEKSLFVTVEAPTAGRAVFAVVLRDLEDPDQYVIGDIVDYVVSDEVEGLAAAH